MHRVEGEALVLIFCEDFPQHPPGTRMNMRFDVDRLATRLMHRAVDDAFLDVVWPAQLAPATLARRASSTRCASASPRRPTSQEREIEGDEEIEGDKESRVLSRTRRGEVTLP